MASSFDDLTRSLNFMLRERNLIVSQLADARQTVVNLRADLARVTADLRDLVDACNDEKAKHGPELASECPICAALASIEPRLLHSAGNRESASE